MHIRSLLAPIVRSARFAIAALVVTVVVGCENGAQKANTAGISGYDYYASERLGGLPSDSVPVAISIPDPSLLDAGRGGDVEIQLDDYAHGHGQVIKVTYPLNAHMLRSQINRTFVRPFSDHVDLPLVSKTTATPGQKIKVRTVSLNPDGTEKAPPRIAEFTIDPPGIADSDENDVKDADIMPGTVAAGKGFEVRVDIKTDNPNDDGQLIKITYSQDATDYLEDMPRWIFVQPKARRVKLSLVTKAPGTVTMYFDSADIHGTVVQNNTESATLTITP